MEVEIFDADKIQLLYTEFNQYETEFYSARIHSIKKNFDDLFRDFSEANKTFSKILKEEAPYYNIFSILNIKHYETYVHTPFLKHLLDPKGSHEQTDFFLKSFIITILKKDFFPDDIDSIEVKEEHSFNEGRIDLFIRYSTKKKPFVLVIENKIYHHDEPQQISRYNTYIRNTLKIPNGNYHIVYLCPRRKPPSRHSISKDEYKCLVDELAITEISYQQDIVPWLENLIPELKKPSSLSEILKQYIETIKTL